MKRIKNFLLEMMCKTGHLTAGNPQRDIRDNVTIPVIRNVLWNFWFSVQNTIKPRHIFKPKQLQDAYQQAKELQ